MSPRVLAGGDAGAPESKLLGYLVGVVVLVLAVALPAGHFALRLAALGSALQTKAEVKAEIINQAIGNSPEMWRYEDLRMRELLVRIPAEVADERARLLGPDGAEVAASLHGIDAPTLVRTAPVFDSGVQVGRVEVLHSVRQLMLESALAVALGGALAFALFQGLQGLRQRERRVLEALHAQQERASVTLRSIGDAVITTDVHGRVDYMNPVAERLTQWSADAALGRPLAEVCPLVDESTMQPVPSPAEKVVREGQPCPFGGRDVALLRRDGGSMAIEDSAAPIHDRAGRVAGAAMVFHDVTATRRMAQRISWAATHDTLTGLVNRREFETRVEAALLSARHSDRHHVVCYLDLDQFKIVNDTCGHAAGDSLLKQMADILQTHLRDADTLARLGGDEFGVLLEGCALEPAQRIAAHLLGAVQAHRFVWQGKSFAVGVSIGLVAVNASTSSRAEVFSHADTACYAAKEQGRNRVCVFESSDADMALRRNEMGWAARLTNALEEDRLVLYYQPYLALGEHSAQGRHIEVLLRLVDEDGKLVLPGTFLPAAERYNLMPAIDRWVIQTVFANHAALARSMGAPLTCAINLSGTTLNAEGILEFIQEQARLHPLPPGAVCFEITETAAINNMRHATQFMRALKALGFSFALDDFGIGTSSLAYLKTLPVDYLKIDGSFVRNIVNDPVDRAMTDTINRVGHIMGLQTVGEYAESEAVVRELRALGVDFAQGYAVQRPAPLMPHVRDEAPAALCLPAGGPPS